MLQMCVSPTSQRLFDHVALALAGHTRQRPMGTICEGTAGHSWTLTARIKFAKRHELCHGPHEPWQDGESVWSYRCRLCETAGETSKGHRPQGRRLVQRADGQRSRRSCCRCRGIGEGK